MKVQSSLIATAAAGLFLAGLAGAAGAEDPGTEAKIKCEGVNGCKGHSDCKTAHSECKGMNSCKGKGFLMMTEAECDAAKAKAADNEDM
jgi:hypothetical protein